jgi:hypothetical protein
MAPSRFSLVLVARQAAHLALAGFGGDAVMRDGLLSRRNLVGWYHLRLNCGPTWEAPAKWITHHLEVDRRSFPEDSCWEQPFPPTMPLMWKPLRAVKSPTRRLPGNGVLRTRTQKLMR